MNQGKLEVIKQEMARVNAYILGISELKWTGMGGFNSDDHCIYYCGQESLRRNRVAITVNKSQKCSTRMQSQKWQNDLCSFSRQTIKHQFSSVQSLSRVWHLATTWLQHARPPCPSPAPGVYHTCVHFVGDAIQPSHPLSSPSPPTFSLSEHEGFFKWISSSYQVTKILVFQLQHPSFQCTPRTGLL